MLCGTFKKRRRHPGDEYRLVRSNTMPRIISGARDVSLVPVRRTKSTRVAARSSLIKDLLHMVRMETWYKMRMRSGIYRWSLMEICRRRREFICRSIVRKNKGGTFSMEFPMWFWFSRRERMSDTFYGPNYPEILFNLNHTYQKYIT